MESQAKTDTAGATRVLILQIDDVVPDGLTLLRESGRVEADWLTSNQILENLQALGGYGAVILSSRGATLDKMRFVSRLVREIAERNLLCLILTDQASPLGEGGGEPGRILPKVQCCSPLASAEEIYGRLCALMDYRPAFDRIERYLGQVEQWAFTLNNRFEELHQELRLAWRVQQDFLPKSLPNDDRVRFAALYRPASWVSGDIYDVFRLDEDNVGFYVADVVGHGVAAGLMTLFVKRGLVTKEIHGSSYRLVPPGQTLAKLNADLCEMDLPEQQFVTTCYAVLNTKTLELTIARAGHPFPFLIDPAGQLSRANCPGPLLGVFRESEFPEARIPLEPGSKVVLTSDGLEQAFGRDQVGEQIVADHVLRLSSLPADRMVETLHGVLDGQESSLHSPDDITLVVAEVLA